MGGMHTDYIDSLKADPRFQKLSPERQDQILTSAHNLASLSPQAIKRVLDFAARLGPIVAAFKRETVKGYIIESEPGKYLTKGLWWYEHAHITDAYVHPESALEEIIHDFSMWETRPTKMYPATYNGLYTEITGEAVPFPGD
jgi:hypothetical protein